MAAVRHGSLPFAEQIEFFRSKVNVPTRAWTDLYAEGHNTGFMVAGALRADLLEDLRAAVDTVIAEGGTLASFREQFGRIVAERGWTGWAGEQSEAGTRWRTRVIYDTNLRQSYNAGREQQMADPELRRRRPYGLYRHGGSADPRPQHLAWDGLVLPLDDPWWDTHSPQNGWGCSCKKFAVGERELDRLGLTVAESAPPVRLLERVVGKNGPSPRVVRVPEGVDPGFEYRPELRTGQMLDTIAAKADAYAQPLAAALIADLARGGALARWWARPEGDYPLAVLDAAVAARIGAGTRTVRLSPDTRAKQIERHPELALADYQRSQEVIDRGRMRQDGERALVYVLEEPAGGYVLVVKATRSGAGLFVTSFRRLSREGARRDRELRRLGLGPGQ